MVEVLDDTIPGLPECLEQEKATGEPQPSPKDGNDGETPQDTGAPSTPVSLPSSYASGSSVCCLNLKQFCIIVYDTMVLFLHYINILYIH